MCIMLASFFFVFLFNAVYNKCIDRRTLIRNKSIIGTDFYELINDYVMSELTFL